MTQSPRNLVTYGQTQTDESDFIGLCQINVEHLIEILRFVNSVLVQHTWFIRPMFD